MAGFNRGRYVVMRGDRWTCFLRRPLDGFDMLGSISVSGEEGALVRRRTDGAYFLARQGRVNQPLVGAKVNAALEQARAA